MTEHLGAGYHELTPTRRGGKRHGRYLRNLLIPAGENIERFEIPRDGEGEFTRVEPRGRDQ
jgi:transposase-like protein